VFTKTATGWTQVAELKGSDTVAGDGFGCSEAILGTTVIAGAPAYVKGVGRAYVFARTASGWRQVAELKASDTVANSGFGDTVVISGTTAIVGDPNALVNRAYVFTKAAGVWKQTAELKGSDTVSGDQFGSPMAVSGATIFVGAPGHDYGAGRAYVFTKTASGWKQVAELKGSDTVDYDTFGASVSMSGTTAIVGANSHANGAGRAYIFEA
jgi:hypothetical protein